jgi:uncharacterized membrane protein YeaQ/YmgE (transglycosylase-associated protein family)
MKFLEEYIGRVVVLLTPVFAGLAGWLATWVAQNLPGGPALDEQALTAIFVSGVGAAVAAVLSWLKGRREYESNEAAIAHERKLLAAERLDKPV